VQVCFFEQARSLAWMAAVNYICDGIYFLRVASGPFTSFTPEDSTIPVVDPIEVRTRYLSREFALDALGIIPLDLMALALDGGALLALQLRLLRLIHIRYVNRSYRAWTGQAQSDNLLTGLVHYIIILFLVTHVSACVWNLVAQAATDEGEGLLTWRTTFNELTFSVGGADGFDRLTEGGLLVHYYLASLWFMMAAVTAVGLTQLPVSFPELMFLIAMLVLNMTVYAWVVGKISALVMKQDDEIVSKRGQLELVQWYLTHLQVPLDLKHDIELFFQQSLEDASLSNVQDDDIHAEMPLQLQIDVSRYTNRQLVAEAKIFDSCGEAFVNRLASTLHERTLEPEMVLFRATDVCKELFIIDSGCVDVYDDEEALASGEYQTLTAGDTAGGVSFFFGLRHWTYARSFSDGETHCYILTADSYRMLSKMFPDEEDIIINNIMHSFDGALAARSARVSVAKSSDSKQSSFQGDGALSAGGSVRAESMISEKEVNDAQNIMASAKKKREDSHIVRLCDAAAGGDVVAVQNLVKVNALDVNKGDYDGRRALHLASCEGHVQVIELLIALNADVNVQDRFQGTPLQDALRHNQAQAGACLRMHGAKLLVDDMADRLNYAAVHADESLSKIRLLLEYGADPMSMDYDQRCALHIAAAEGHVETVKLLVEHNAAINPQDRWGATPLQESFRRKHKAVSTYLMAHGGNMGDFDAAAKLCDAAASDDVELLEWLLFHGCNVNSADYDLRTPLHLGASNGRLATTHFLLDKSDINVNAEDRFGNTAYDDALRENTRADGSGLHDVILALVQKKGGKPGSHVKKADSDSSLDSSNDEKRTRETEQVIERQNVREPHTTQGRLHMPHRSKLSPLPSAVLTSALHRSPSYLPLCHPFVCAAAGRVSLLRLHKCASGFARMGRVPAT